MTDRASSQWWDQYETVYRFVSRRIASREDAEDVTQEVFLAAASALAQSRVRAGSPPLAWLYTVARRRLVDRLRASKPDDVTLDEVHVPDSRSERAYGPTIATALLEGIHCLSQEHREVVTLKLLEGRPFAEIGLQLGITETAARMRCSRALSQLRSHLEGKGVTP